VSNEKYKDQFDDLMVDFGTSSHHGGGGGGGVPAHSLLITEQGNHSYLVDEDDFEGSGRNASHQHGDEEHEVSGLL